MAERSAGEYRKRLSPKQRSTFKELEDLLDDTAMDPVDRHYQIGCRLRTLEAAARSEFGEEWRTLLEKAFGAGRDSNLKTLVARSYQLAATIGREELQLLRRLGIDKTLLLLRYKDARVRAERAQQALEEEWSVAVTRTKVKEELGTGKGKVKAAARARLKRLQDQGQAWLNEVEGLRRAGPEAVLEEAEPDAELEHGLREVLADLPSAVDYLQKVLKTWSQRGSQRR
jgi:hypothetical protein